MKTRQELVEHYRAEIAKENNLQKNAEAAGEQSMAAYHTGRKEVFKIIADYLTIWQVPG